MVADSAKPVHAPSCPWSRIAGTRLQLTIVSGSGASVG